LNKLASPRGFEPCPLKTQKKPFAFVSSMG
jgi:hypothetical protein